jgi:hypothetical protein
LTSGLINQNRSHGAAAKKSISQLSLFQSMTGFALIEYVIDRYDAFITHGAQMCLTYANLQIRFQ